MEKTGFPAKDENKIAKCRAVSVLSHEYKKIPSVEPGHFIKNVAKMETAYIDKPTLWSDTRGGSHSPSLN